jgi:hypothetical protein
VRHVGGESVAAPAEPDLFQQLARRPEQRRVAARRTPESRAAELRLDGERDVVRALVR